MVRKVFKTGNSLVISLPKESLECLQLQEGSSVTLKLDKEKKSLTLFPLEENSSGISPEYADQVSKFISEYRTALEALAK